MCSWCLKQVILPYQGKCHAVRVPRTVRVRQFEAQKKNVPSQDETFLAPQTGYSSLFLGQKHSRTARLQRFTLLLVSSCPGTAFIYHRQRQHLTQLTARAHFIISVGRATRIVTAMFQVRNLLSDIKEPKKKNLLRFFWRLKQGIPLPGEMSRSNKRVGR